VGSPIFPIRPSEDRFERLSMASTESPQPARRTNTPLCSERFALTIGFDVTSGSDRVAIRVLYELMA